MADQNLLSQAPSCFGTLSRWSKLHLQSLTPINPHWARVVGYGPFSLCVIGKEGLCTSSGDINRLMMMMMKELSEQPSAYAQNDRIRVNKTLT
jgi:hypothetical protein